MGAKKWKTTGKKELTIQEQEFCRLYLFGEDGTRGNGSECWRRVYLNPYNKTETQAMTWNHSHQLMKKPHIKETIEEWQKAHITKEYVLATLEQFASDKSIKPADRVRATELLGKAQGLFVDKSEVNIKTDAIFEEET